MSIIIVSSSQMFAILNFLRSIYYSTALRTTLFWRIVPKSKISLFQFPALQNYYPSIFFLVYKFLVFCMFVSPSRSHRKFYLVNFTNALTNQIIIGSDEQFH